MTKTKLEKILQIFINTYHHYTPDKQWRN